MEVRANKAPADWTQTSKLSPPNFSSCFLQSRPFVDDRLAKDLEGATIILDGNSRLLEAAQVGSAFLTGWEWWGFRGRGAV